jgi:hypothetical protein
MVASRTSYGVCSLFGRAFKIQSLRRGNSTYGPSGLHFAICIQNSQRRLRPSWAGIRRTDGYFLGDMAVLHSPCRPGGEQAEVDKARVRFVAGTSNSLERCDANSLALEAI